MSKKYQAQAKLIEPGKFYTLSEAVALVKKTAWAKFDESVDLALKLGVDPKKHSVRGTVSLPAGSGKSKRVAVIAKPDKMIEAQDAGAEVVGSEDLAEKIKNGFLDFDILISTPDMMGVVGKLGKVLGPKGLMPNPKTGTVTLELGQTVKEFKSGKVEFKMDKTSVLHVVLGKVSFEPQALASNFRAALAAILRTKPSGLKGNFIQSLTLSSSMGPGVKVELKQAQETNKEV